jgi:hypothetical protein
MRVPELDWPADLFADVMRPPEKFDDDLGRPGGLVRHGVASLARDAGASER